jgi:dipeptidyl aminopeptidase/acylaminoacyl peptidase
MRRLVLFLAVLAVALPVAGQAKHPFTFEDMMKLKRVGDPQVSPDGKWVIFSVVDVDLAANTKTPHIWIVPTAGGEEKELIADQDAGRPRWAPDGKRFAFVSTKAEGSSQIWVADFDNMAGTVTGTHRWTSIATEASGELWSPDGKNILFTSDVYPECDGTPEAENSCNAKKSAAANASKVKAQIFDHLLYRHWNAYREGKRSHIFVIPAPPTNDGSMIPRDLTPGDYESPVFSLGGQDDYAFSPDGKEICYASNHDKNPAASTNNDLWIVPVTGGPAGSVQAKNITADNPASDTSPLYSPDGRYIAYRAQQRPGYESDRFRLMLYDRKTGEKKNLTEDFDSWVNSVTWSPDSKTIYFTTAVAGDEPIDSVPVSGGKPKRVIGGFASYDSPIILGDSKTIIYSGNSMEMPTEILKSTLGDPEMYYERTAYDGFENRGGGLPVAKVTHVNDDVLSRVEMATPQAFVFKGAKGDDVQGFIVRPPNFDANKKYPVKFLIHGGPQGAWGDDWSYRWNPELFASPTSSTPSGYVVIMINFHGSTGYGQKFIDAINGDWGGAPYEDLMKGLDYAENTYPFIDKNRECALGASYGGYMINWILGHTDRFKCLVSHDGMFNAESAWGTTEELWFNNWEFKGTPYDNRASYEKWSPHQYAKNFKTPTLVIHGQRDYRLDVSEGFQLFTTLQMEGVPSKMLYFPDEGHWVLKPQNSQLWYKTVNDWVDQWIGGQATK